MLFGVADSRIARKNPSDLEFRGIVWRFRAVRSTLWRFTSNHMFQVLEPHFGGLEP